MNLDKMNELTSLILNLKDNSVKKIELSRFVEWSGNRLMNINVDLKRNKIEALNNKIVDCEVYLDLRDNYFEDE